MKFTDRKHLQYAAHTPLFIQRMSAGVDADRPKLSDKHARNASEGVGDGEADCALADLGTDDAPVVVVVNQKRHLALAEIEKVISRDSVIKGEAAISHISPATREGGASSAAVHLGGKRAAKRGRAVESSISDDRKAEGSPRKTGKGATAGKKQCKAAPLRLSFAADEQDG